MGWVDEQIKTRIQSDDEAFSKVFADMSASVIGRNELNDCFSTEAQKTQNAIEDILRFYHMKAPVVPDDVVDINDRLDFMMRPTGIMYRLVSLTDNWYRDAIGAFMGRTNDGNPIALIPHGINGYCYYDWDQKKKIKVDKTTAKNIAKEAFCFYKPLPQKALALKNLFHFILDSLSWWDSVSIVLALFSSTLLGLVLPKINQYIFNTVIPVGHMNLLAGVVCVLLGTTVSIALLGIIKSMCLNRAKVKLDSSVKSASMMRLLAMPPSFFKDYSAGELASRLELISQVCKRFADTIIVGGCSVVFSLIYIIQLSTFTPVLLLPALLILFVYLAMNIITTVETMKVTRKVMLQKTKQYGLVYRFFSSITKIKLSGAEKRVFTKWGENYAELAKNQYNPPVLVKLGLVVTTAVTLLGSILIYWIAGSNGVAVGDYMAFSASFGAVTGIFVSLSQLVQAVSQIQPVMELIKPILATAPEIREDKTPINRLSGAIELNNISFRYSPETPLILDDFSIKIRSGQYVAIVGRTGCGKSTLIRLLLGFETPQMGAIYYDGKDLSTIDIKSLRRRIGTVMQNGKLFQGDIYSNIVINAPTLTMDDAWKAAELAGIAQDIRNMPMGMQTMISEQSGGVSGGQRQRLMIARAIANNPKILIFDEATSALDNIAQKVVSDSLNALKCTRIVVAHRLSTIKNCNRIIVLEGGKIAEDGTYDELIAKNGIFADLVSRQRLD